MSNNTFQVTLRENMVNLVVLIADEYGFLRDQEEHACNRATHKKIDAQGAVIHDEIFFAEMFRMLEGSDREHLEITIGLSLIC